MRNSDDRLWQLIKSLTTAEKRYFKLQATQHGTISSNYVYLFNAIDKQKTYNEETLKKQFEGIDLATLKSQLKGIILDHLASLNSINNEQEKLYRETQKAWILGQKGFKADALKMLSKTVVKANSCGFYTVVLKALQNMKHLSMASSLDENEHLTKQELETLEHIRLEAELYMLIRCILQFRFEREVVNNEQDRQHLDAIITQPILQAPNEHWRPGALYFYHTIHAIYYSILRDDDTSSVWYKKALNVLKHDPDIARQRAENYFNQLNSYISKLSAKGFTTEFTEELKELHASIDNPVFKKVKQLEDKVHVLSFNHKAQAYCYDNNYKDGATLVEQFERDHLDRLPRLAPQITITTVYRGMYLTFWAGQYNNTLDWIKRIYQLPIDATGIVTTAKLIEIMAHYELGNLELLSSIILNTKRYLKKNDSYSPIAKAITDQYNNLLKVLPVQTTHVFKKLHTELTELKSSPDENPLFVFFDFAAWIQQHKLQ